MIRDHLAVNKKLMALLHKLKMTPEASDTSKTIYRNASIKQEELWKFDKAYAENEVAYHEAVNGALESTLIPSAQDGELKSLLETDLKLFKEHQKHAEHLVSELK
jgi:putative membrane protein